MKAKIPIINTTAQQKALDTEINRQLAEHMREHEADYIAYAMWAAHITFGFGKKRLEQFCAALREGARELEAHYEMNNGGFYLARKQLEQIGVKVEPEKNKIFDFEVKK